MALRAAKLTVNLYRGDDYPYQFIVKTSTNAVYNATGSTLTMTIRDIIDGTILWSANATDGQNGNNFATGTFVFIIPNATSSLINDDAVFDVQELTSTSKKNTLVFGDVIVQKDVT